MKHSGIAHGGVVFDIVLDGMRVTVVEMVQNGITPGVQFLEFHGLVWQHPFKVFVKGDLAGPGTCGPLGVGLVYVVY